MTNPESLVARVLKARYFKHQDIMDANIGNNPSFIWRSLLWSRQLIVKGISWRVGNGKRIQTFRDNWIPGSRIPLQELSNQETYKTVNSLIHEGAWNELVIRQLFPSYIVGEIMTIPIAGELTEDSRFWRHDPKGFYSVRDGYKVDTGYYETPPNCSEIQSRSWWKFLWALSIPPKVRIFWWRTLHNIIPTEINLLVHHVPVHGQCRLYKSRSDTTDHALFWCPTMKSCWKNTAFKQILKRAKGFDIVEIFLWMKEQLDLKHFEFFAVRTWAVWHERLQLLHKEDRNLDKVGADWSIHMLTEYKDACTAISLAPIHSTSSTQSRWQKPEHNHLRLETDAAYNENANSYSVGGVIRNHEGHIVLAFGRQIKKTPSVVYAELEAMREGLGQAREHSLNIQEVTSDSLLAVQAVTSTDEDLSYTGVISNEVRKLLKSWREISVNHVRRSANRVAHSIAFFAISSPSPFVWELGNLPFWLINLVTYDLLNS